MASFDAHANQQEGEWMVSVGGTLFSGLRNLDPTKPPTSARVAKAWRVQTRAVLRRLNVQNASGKAHSELVLRKTVLPPWRI